MLSHGTVSDGVVIKSENLGINNLMVRDILKREHNCNISIANDAKCAAMAEKKFGSLKEYDDALFLIIGTGVGGAAFLGGKLLEPKRYSGFEVGHMVIKKGGKKCSCGRKGCFEIYSAMRELRSKVNRTFNLGLTDGRKIRRFIEKNRNDEKLNKILEDYTENLNIAISNLINIFEPEAICIGGSFAYYKGILLGRLKRKLAKKEELYNKDNIPKLVLAKYRNDAGIIGAAML